MKSEDYNGSIEWKLIKLVLLYFAVAQFQDVVLLGHGFDYLEVQVLLVSEGERRIKGAKRSKVVRY